MKATAGGQTAPESVPPGDMIPVALVEDNRLVREGITSLLARYPDIRVVASEPGDPRALPRSSDPRVILLDLGLEHGESLSLARRVIQDFPDAGVIVMDLLPAHEEIVDFIGAGVSAFVMKDATLEELVRTIRSVAAGEEVLPPEMTHTLFSEIARDAVSNDAPHAADSVRMTPREREVIGLIAEGLSNRAIGERLGISTHTVKSHLRNIMEKLTLHTRLEIAAYVHRRSDEP